MVPSTPVSNFADMYSAFDQIREMGAEAGARVVAGHDPVVAERFGGRAGSDNVILLSPAALPAGPRSVS